MAEKKDDKDAKSGEKAAEKAQDKAVKGVAHEMDDMDLRVSHLEAAVGTSYHPTPEEAAEAAEEAEKARAEAAEQAEKDAAKAAEEAEEPA